MITYSAPAKIIISGEHSVVFGKPALVCAINLRLKLSVFESSRKTKNKIMIFIANKVKEYLDENKLFYKDKEFDFKIDSEIPIGRGMGSSAALSVAGAACFFELYTGKRADLNVVNSLGYQIEKYFHNNSSGVDVAVSCYGGLIYYRREFEFLRQITKLNFNIPDIITNKLYLIDSGKPQETTGEMVLKVENWRKNHFLVAEKIFNKMEIITKEFALSLKGNKTEPLTKLILANNNCLEKIGVVSSRAKKIISNLNKFGAAKITGAGGKISSSGFILFYSKQLFKTIEYCRKNNLRFYKLSQSKSGLKKI